MKKLIFETGIRSLWITVIVLAVDLWSKYVALHKLSLGEIVPLFSFFNIHYVRNYGAAFSLFSSRNSWQNWFLIGSSISICIVFLLLMYYTKPEQKLRSISYALIIGGASGNLFDRLWHGFVIDMIDLHINDWHFAIFNFADSIIFTGVSLIVLENIYRKNLLNKNNV